MQANQQQLTAIESLDGPLLIIAGPGAGKTFTLVERTINLISTRDIDPSRILVSTFTEKAAKELLTRISNRLFERGISVNPADMAIGTLHSIFLRLLEEFRPFTRIRRNYTVLDQFDQQYFFYQNLTDFRGISGLEDLLHPGHKVSGWWFAEALMVRLNKLSEESIDAEVLLASAIPEFQILGTAYQKYQQLPADLWTAKARMPTARSAIGAAVYNNYILVAGGKGQDMRFLAVFKAVEAYNTAVNRWEVLPSMPHQRHGLGIGVIGDRFYTVSGDGQSAGNGIAHTAVPYNEALQLNLVLK